jgi:hypothetical protein
MIATIPTVDNATHPHVANLVSTYAARYEFRLDGSSVWEGRVRFIEYPVEVPGLIGLRSRAYHAFLERQAAYPPLQIPSAFTLLHAGGGGTCEYYQCDAEQAILAYQSTDLFIVQHPDPATYAWELAHIRRAEYPAHPRQILTGFAFTLGYRERLLREGLFWL